MINNKDQNVLIFGSYGWSGEAQEILSSLAKSLQLKPFEKGIHIRFAPDAEDLKTIENTTINFLKTI
jgi:flavorubredoxin